MNKILLTLSLLIILPITSGRANDIKKFNSDITISVSGMVCDFCAQSLKKVFGKNDAVENIDVNLDEQTITVDLKENQTLGDETIKSLIIDAGYTLTEIKREKQE